jgi:hypothetical protein
MSRRCHSFEKDGKVFVVILREQMSDLEESKRQHWLNISVFIASHGHSRVSDSRARLIHEMCESRSSRCRSRTRTIFVVGTAHELERRRV